MLERLRDLVVRPEVAFRDIARNPKFLAPWLLSAFLFAFPMLAAVSRIGPARLFGNIVALVEIDPLLADQPQELLFGAVERLFDVLVILTPLLAIPLTVACLLPMLPTLGLPRGTRLGALFRPLMAVTAWAALPPAAGMFVTVMIVLAVRDPKTLSLGSLTPLDLGVLIPASWSPVLHNIASTMEFFSMWSVYLLMEGIAAAAGVSFRRTFVWLALPLIIFAWIVAAVLAVIK
jgi:hypothetical protein